MERVVGNYEEFLRDESRKTGNADTISFPVCEQDIRNTIMEMSSRNIEITVQGSRTGVTAGAVPLKGHILNLERMNKITGMSYDESEAGFYLYVQPGILLSKLKEYIESKEFETTGWESDSISALEKFRQAGEWFFPPDPTETSASLGGMTACNASGARTFYYGPTRNYIKALEIVTADASMLKLERKQNQADGLVFSLVSDNGNVYTGKLPNYLMPNVKNAAGYHVSSDMELIDLFIGSEGTLGIITSIKLQLVRKPGFIWGMTAFIPNEDAAMKFVQEIRNKRDAENDESFKLAAIEYFNKNALDLLKNMKKCNEAFSGSPEIPEGNYVAIYTEFHGDSEEQVCNIAMEATEILEACGGNGDDTWLASNSSEMERMHYFRHAIPEAVNLTIDILRKNDPKLSKLGTDMAVPDEKLEEVVHMYNMDLLQEGLQSVIFGHIGNNHLHVNIIPKTMEEYERGRALYLRWAEKVVKMGGTISAEHGTGKIKTALLRQMYGDFGIKEMKKLKAVFDPRNLLNRGNIFEI